MSTTVDNRVVEMRFDNQHFEKNVQTTMSTLDKLKQSLNLTGASKGLENINASANKVNFSVLGNAVETVRLKFSALEVMGVTALANITNSAVNTGKRMISALTIDPIKTGLSEYETQINAVQTILANTQSKGTTLDDVNSALDELNKYADMTIYNFTEMTRNIGTFTAAGVDLDTSVSAIKGIANLAAVSGSTSQQASTAMYQLSQALASGTVKLQDWNSVVNAGMGGQVFQDALKRTATVMGTNVDAMIEKYGSFRESLSKGEWLTTEVLTETLNQFTMCAKEGTKEWENYKKSLKEKGYTEEQAEEILKMANTATEAATKVKTFTQLWDVLKEAAQSGWTQTWELIIGDFEEAKNLFSPLSDFLTGVINGISDARNKLLEGALGSPLGQLVSKIENVTGATEKMVEVTKDYGDIVDRVINGEFGSGQARWDKLTEQGYDWAKVQNLVNEKMGDGTRHAEKLAEAEKEVGKGQVTMSELLKMSNGELQKNYKFTTEEIKALRELEEQSEKTGIPIEELMKDMDKLSGRTLLINSFKNAGSGLIGIFTALKNAWVEIFPPMTSKQLYNIIAAMHKFSTYLRLTDEKTGKLTETGEKLQRTFKGIFAILDVVTTIIGGGFKIAFKVASSLLGYFNLDILDVTASIGDALVAFRDWVDSIFDINRGLDVIVPALKSAKDAIKKWIDGMKDAEDLPKYIADGIINGLKSAVKLIGDVITELGGEALNNLKKFLGRAPGEEASGDLITGLKNGLVNGATIAVQAIIELAKNILQEFRDILGIHSPSRETYTDGENFVQGFINGVKDFASGAWAAIKEFGASCLEAFNKIDFGKVLAAGLGVGILVVVKELSDTLAMFGAPLEGVGDMLSGIGSAFEDFGKGLKANLKAKALDKKSHALLNLAIAIGVLAISCLILGNIPREKLIQAGVALLVLVGVIGALAFIATKMSKIGDMDFGKTSLSILAIAGSLLLMATAMHKLSKIKAEDTKKVIALTVAMVVGLGAVLVTFGHFVKGEAAANMDKAGFMLMKIGSAIGIMVIVIKLISTLSAGEIVKGLAVISAFGILCLAFIETSQYAGQNASTAGSMLLKISFAFLIMVGVIKLVSGLEGGEILKGLAVITALGLVFGALIAVSKLAGANAAKAGGMLLMMSIAMAIAVSVVKQVSGLEDGDIKRGIAVIIALGAVFTALTAVSHLAGQNAVKAGVMLLLMSGALLVLTGVLFIISKMDDSGLGRALGIIAVLEILFGGLIAVSKLATDCKGTLIVLVVAIGILTTALIALSFIDSKKLAAATGALSGVITAFALLVAATKFAKNTKPMIKSLVAMTIVVAALAGVVALLSLVDSKNALTNTVSLSILLTAFASSLAILGKAGRISTTVTKTLAPMVAVVAGLAVILGVMSYLNVQASIPTAIALGILLNAMCAAMVVLSKAKKVSVGSVATLLIMGLVVGELAFILGKMSELNVQASIPTALALSVLLLAMTVVCAAVSVIPAAAAINGALGLAAFVGIMGVVLAALGGLSKIPGFNELIADGGHTLGLIGAAIGNFVGSIIGGALGGLSAGLPEIGTNLSTFITNATPFITGVKMVDGTVLEGAGILAGVISVLTAASLLDGIVSFLPFSTSFAEMGSKLTEFMVNAMPFIALSRMLDESSMNAVKMLAETILILTSANIIEGIGRFVTGSSSLETFGTQLPEFGKAIAKFSMAVSRGGGINTEAVEAAANAGKIMAELQKNLYGTGGVIQWFNGEKDLGAFGKQLETYAVALVNFSWVVSQPGAINEEAVEAAKKAGMIMTELQSSLVATGGVIQAFTGHKNLATFGKQLEAYGIALVNFSNTVAGEDGTGAIDAEAVEAAKKAGMLMTELQSSIEPIGGVVSLFTSQKNLALFGQQIKAFGKALVEFSDEVAGEISEEAVGSAALAGGVMAALQESLPEDTWFDGKMTLDDFGKTIKKFGNCILDYSESVALVDTGAVSSSLTSAQTLVSITKSLTDLDTSGIEKFKVTTLGDAIKDYSDSVSEVDPDALDSSITSINRLMALITRMEDIDLGGVKSFKQAVGILSNVDFAGLEKTFSGAVSKFTTLGSNLVDAINRGVSSKQTSLVTTGVNIINYINRGVGNRTRVITTTMTKIMSQLLVTINKKQSGFLKAGSQLMTMFNSGISSHSGKAKTILTQSLGASVTAIRGYYGGFYNAGVYLIDGLIAGLQDNAPRLIGVAQAIAYILESTLEGALEVNSPSKVTYRIGDFAGQGLVNGLEDNDDKAYKAAFTMGEYAKKGLSKAISKITDVINGDMDTQPTIRPVLDLSDISSGVGYMNDMFNLSPSVGVMSNISSIDSMMNRRQNGVNDDVVSAIEDLKNTIGNAPQNNYNFGNFTYSGDSEINNAVQVLVRAAKMERRV